MEKTNICGDNLINNSKETGHYNIFGNHVWINPDHSEQICGKIGNFCHFSNDVKLGCNVSVGDHVSIGSNVIISDNCTIGSNVVIGENVFIEENTVIQDGCIIVGNVIIGKNNVFSQGCIIGYRQKKDMNGLLRIGDNNFFGVHCVLHNAYSLSDSNETVIGSHVFCDSNVVISPNCLIAAKEDIPYNQAAPYTTYIFANTVIKAKSEVGNGCNIMENVIIYPQKRLGAGCYVEAFSYISADVVPFAWVKGDKIIFYYSYCLDKNLEFNTTDESILSLVGEMVFRTSSAKNSIAAQDVIENFKGRGFWHDKAYAVIKDFLTQSEEKRRLMTAEQW